MVGNTRVKNAPAERLIIMWYSFLSCLIVASLILFVPGSLLLCQLNMRLIKSLGFAPIVSIALYSIIELALAEANISSSIPLLLCITSSILFACIVVRMILSRRFETPSAEGRVLGPLRSYDWSILIYVSIGCLAVLVFFVKQLDGPDSFFQGWDNVTHLNGIRALMNSDNWNPLSLNRFTEADVSPYIDNGSSFYPSALHVLCASVASVVGVAPAVALNAVNAVMVGLVFPLGFHQLISTLSNHSKFVVYSGALLCLGNAVAPWDMLIYGPLFPNLFSFSFIPSVMAIFILTCKEISKGRWVLACRDGMIVLLGALSVFLGHPNGIFSLIVLLAPYLFHWGWCELRERGLSTRIRIAIAAAYLFFIGVFWIVCYGLPMFTSVVGVSWPAINNSIFDAAVDVLLFSYVMRPKNFILSCLMLVGFATIFRDRRYFWLNVSMLVSQFLYAVCAGTDGEIKQLLTGFWYTDYYRVAALAAYASSLVACFGLGKIIECLVCLLKRILAKSGFVNDPSEYLQSTLSVGAFLLAGCLIFNGNVVLPFVGHIELPLGYQAAETARQYDKALIHYDVLTVEELAFVDENRKFLGDGSTIINEPNDGSLFLYATDNMNTYYRSGSCPSQNEETEDSRLIRTKLYDIDTNDQVKSAVKRVGARYVLQLDYGEREDECRINYMSYYPEDWIGVQSINENTPGFTLIAENQDMRLFRIDGV